MEFVGGVVSGVEISEISESGDVYGSLWTGYCSG